MSVASVDIAIAPKRRFYIRGVISKLIKLAIGVLLCLTPFTAILVLGWFMRFMRREMFLVWRKKALNKIYSPEYEHLPNWIMAQTKQRSLFLNLFGSFFENLKLGLHTLFAVSLVTLPYGVLWILAWWAGWSNSFNKGYEQAFVGPITALVGLVFFILIMTYLPMAIANQAAVGNWRGLFRTRSIINLVLYNRIAFLFLSLLWVLAALPIFLLRGYPVFIDSVNPGFFSLPHEEIVEFAKSYHFLATVYIFLAMLFLRRMTARIYAGGSLKLLQSNSDEFTSSVWQWQLFDTLKISVTDHKPARMHSVLSVCIMLVFFLLVAIIWIAFAFQILVAQFLNHDWIMWIWHPLIQLPWFKQFPVVG